MMAEFADHLEKGSPFRLKNLIAAGSRARVYLADAEAAATPLVVKFLIEEEFPDNEIAAKNIEHEARCLSLSAHEHVVKFLSTHQDQKDAGRPYLVMEYAPGKTLKELMEAGDLDQSAVINVAIQICTALENMHKVGVLHLDLRPDKIMLEPLKKGYQAKLVGFGRAGLLPWAGREQLIESPGKVGLYSLQYISPDQAMEKRCLPASDVYSLGCIIYEALAGRPPFRGENELHLMAQHLNTPVEEISSVKADSKLKKYDEVIMQALAKEAHMRFVDACEFKEALGRLVPASGGWISRLFNRS